MEELETTDQLQEDAALVAEDSSTPDPFDSGADSFDRGYVERLRKESAQYRTRAKEYETYATAFEPYTDDDRKVWFEAARLINEDPKAGGEYMRQIADAILAEYQEQAPEPVEGDDAPLTMAQYKALQAEQAAAAKEAAEIARVEAEAVELGYKPDSLDYRILLQVALETTKGDMKAAHEQLRAREQAAVDRYLAGKAAEADAAPPVGTEAGHAPSGEKQIRTFEDAREAAEARVRAFRGQ